MNTINYTIIIPHKDIPVLLKRCLDSIPYRKDIQIIVIDDNSNPSIVDFNNFPGLNDSRVEIVFDKNEKGQKGAGYARNIGLKKAKGKWTIFADADDYFVYDIGKAMDKYKDDPSELIYFETSSVSFKDKIIYEKEYLLDKKYSFLYEKRAPWNKFIKTNIILSNNIHFEEVLYANDVLFCIKLLNNVRKIKFSNLVIYEYISRKGSLSNNHTLESLVVRFKEADKAIKEASRKDNNNELLKYNLLFWWLGIWHKNRSEGYKLLYRTIKNCRFLFFIFLFHKILR